MDFNTFATILVVWFALGSVVSLMLGSVLGKFSTPAEDGFAALASSQKKVVHYLRQGKPARAQASGTKRAQHGTARRAAG
jgi:hypothetical protein